MEDNTKRNCPLFLLLLSLSKDFFFFVVVILRTFRRRRCCSSSSSFDSNEIFFLCFVLFYFDHYIRNVVSSGDERRYLCQKGIWEKKNVRSIWLRSFFDRSMDSHTHMHVCTSHIDVQVRSGVCVSQRNEYPGTGERQTERKMAIDQKRRKRRRKCQSATITTTIKRLNEWWPIKGRKWKIVNNDQ